MSKDLDFDDFGCGGMEFYEISNDNCREPERIDGIAQGAIPSELREDHDLILLSSGGKDSTAVALWLMYESGLKNRMFMAFCDTGHEHPLTVDYIHRLAERLNFHLHVVRGEYKFIELCEQKQRFPAPSARFCTEDLKVRPMSDWLDEMYGAGHIDKPVLVQGVRWQESEARSGALVWDTNNKPGYRRVFECPVWRPVVAWKHEDVFAIHDRHGIEPNPLYKMGAKRVGCFPCIFSSKADLRSCFEMDPYLIDRLRDYERRVCEMSNRGTASFFSAAKIPKRFHDRHAVAKDGTPYSYASIDAVYEWAMSDIKVLDQMDMGPSCRSHYGLCE